MMKPATVTAAPRRRLLGAMAGLLGTAACANDGARTTRDSRHTTAPVESRADALSVALLGDIPYRASELANLPALLDDISAHAHFAIHVGDIKSGIEPCSDQLLESRILALSTLRIPLIYTPGDNEWTDCWRLPAGGYDPLERLGWLRKRVFARPIPLLGGIAAPLPFTGLAQQSGEAGDLPENLLWRSRGVVFATLNLPGSENGRRSPVDESEHQAREAANRRWLDYALNTAIADEAPCLAIAVHANPDLGRGLDPQRLRGDDSYAGFRHELAKLLARFNGQVLLMHGDTHRFRVNRITSRLTRVESFGSPFSSSWVRIGIRPGDSEPFSVQVRNV